ncbi:Hcp family type VI secretion system effector [Candidatus Methylocalor cossyra]|uniref:Protein hcp1 n=1 Tax=Candidatus Methylocalor cossyra TaxID=3108543 RepID=A0ABP1C6B3_9GAMM
MAQVDYFLKIDGIKGESQDDKHKDEIAIESWSWGETNTGSFSHGGGGGTGKVQMEDFRFVKRMDKASPGLFLSCASGKHIPKAELVCREAGEQPAEYLKITLSDVLISSYQAKGPGADVIRPTEEFSLNFAKIEFEYSEQKADGSVVPAGKTGWDLKAHKKL